MAKKDTFLYWNVILPIHEYGDMKCGILVSPIYFRCRALYVKELQRECHKIVISYVYIGVMHIYRKIKPK